MKKFCALFLGAVLGLPAAAADLHWEFRIYREAADNGQNKTWTEVFLVTDSPDSSDTFVGWAEGDAVDRVLSDALKGDLMAASVWFAGSGIQLEARRDGRRLVVLSREALWDDSRSNHIQLSAATEAASVDLAASDKVTVSAPVTRFAKSMFSRTLSRKIPKLHGPDVWALQRFLDMQGYGDDLGEIDGWFGDQTKSALQRFQNEHQMPPDGVADASVWDQLSGPEDEEPEGD